MILNIMHSSAFLCQHSCMCPAEWVKNNTGIFTFCPRVLSCSLVLKTVTFSRLNWLCKLSPVKNKGSVLEAVKFVTLFIQLVKRCRHYVLRNSIQILCLKLQQMKITISRLRIRTKIQTQSYFLQPNLVCNPYELQRFSIFSLY